MAAISKDALSRVIAFPCGLCNSFAKSNCFISDYDSLGVGSSWWSASVLSYKMASRHHTVRICGPSSLHITVWVFLGFFFGCNTVATYLRLLCLIHSPPSRERVCSTMQPKLVLNFLHEIIGLYENSRLKP